MTDFTPAERVHIAHACEDYAGRYYGGPMRLSRDDAVRYVAEGHLRALERRYDFRRLYEAFAAYVAEHPEVLGRRLSDEEVDARVRERQARADDLAARAGRAYREGRYAHALVLLDEAELAAPGHRPRHRTYDEMRERVRAAQRAAGHGAS